MGNGLLWDERYAKDDYIYGTNPNEFLGDSVSHIPPSGRVLCLGEGEGRNSVFLAQQGFDVYAVDISRVGKDKALRLAADRGVTIHYDVMDVNDFDFGVARWDAIVSIFAHTDAKTRRHILNRVSPALKQEGVFILEAYHPNQLQMNYDTGGPKDVTWMIDPDEIHGVFSDVGIVYEFSGERAVYEGSGHTGQAFVTQFIWRKDSKK
ncbi:MAG: hypothetical protein AUJ12_04590 [Alphaproteobacteria bacterium CG1_02_46_17]|nr:MAG: hypothetical protein AUJ12_04590 [Alphaproteobacteria bacterium CG1_02_46_17]